MKGSQSGDHEGIAGAFTCHAEWLLTGQVMVLPDQSPRFQSVAVCCVEVEVLSSVAPVPLSFANLTLPFTILKKTYTATDIKGALCV